MTNNLRVLRAMANISQAQLASAIGVSRQTVNAIETARYVPSTVLALKIASYFKKQVEEIFALESTD